MLASVLFALLPAFALAAPSPQDKSASVLNTFGNIHPSVNLHKCIDVPGNNQYPGAQIQLYDCNGTAAQHWNVPNSGSTGAVQLVSSNYCLSAGGGPGDGTRVSIDTCDGSDGQAWENNSDGTFRLQNTNFCLDLNNDNTENGNYIQVWTCYDGSAAQQWRVSGQ